MDNLNFYVVVHQTKHPDYPVMSGYDVEANNQHSAEQVSRRMFCEDTGYQFDQTAIRYVKTGREAGSDETR